MPAMSELMARTRAKHASHFAVALTISMVGAGCVPVDQQIGGLDSESGEASAGVEATTSTEETTGPQESTGDETTGPADETTGESETTGPEQGTTGDEEQIEDDCLDGTSYLDQLLSANEDPAQGIRCSIVVRHDVDNLLPIGWQLLCGPTDGALSLQEARALTEWGQGAQDLSEDERYYMLYKEPVDFGSISYVSRRSGLLVEGSIFWGGQGNVVFPATDAWMDPWLLGSDCDPLDFEPLAFELHTYLLWDDEFQTSSDATILQMWQTALFYAAVEPGVIVTQIGYDPSVGFEPLPLYDRELITVIDRSGV